MSEPRYCRISQKWCACQDYGRRCEEEFGGEPCARNDGGVDIYRHDLVRDYAIDDQHDTRDSHITHWMPLPRKPSDSENNRG